MVIFTVPFSLMVGRTRSVRPTSLRSTVVNGLMPTEPEVLAYWPVTKGTFWPMTILASSLSSVSRLGVESTLASPSLVKKFAIAPRMYCPPILPAMARFSPDDGRTLATSRVARACVSARMLALARLELVPMTALLPSALCHCTPKLAAFLALTSTISASIITWARRPSSLSITARICRY